MSNLFKHASRQLRSSRKALIVLSAIVLYAVPFLFFNGFSEGAAYIKFDGIDGESLDKDHKGWSDLLSFGFGISRQTGTDGKVFPKVEIEVTGITKPIDKSTPILMTMCANPDGLPTGSVEYSKEIRGERQTYLKLELKDVIVSSYQFGASMTRVDEGEFGSCSHCEEEISPRRLQAVPWARYCVSCQERSEQGLLYDA